MKQSPPSKRMQSLVHDLLGELGEDPTREGLRRTPARGASMYEFLTKGYKEDIASVVNRAVF
ncbi:MAG: GTP cyclohydrolase I, partial [Bacteroidota bacterium]